MSAACSTTAVLVGQRPSVPFRDLMAAAAGRDVPVLIPRDVNDATPELATLAEASGAAVQVASDDLVADGRRLGVQSVVTFDEAHAYECLAATVTLRGTDAPRPADKLEMRELLRELGLTDVRAWPVASRDSIEALLREAGPVIVKPRRGVSSQAITVIRDASDLARLAGAIDTVPQDFYAEEFRAHRPFGAHADWHAAYLSVDVFSGGGEPGFMLADRKRSASDLSETASIVPSRVDAEMRDELVDRARRIAAVWGNAWPAFHIEFLSTDAGFELIEVNPRLGGALHALTAELSPDTDLAGMVLDRASGRATKLPAFARQGAYLWVQPPAEARRLTAAVDVRTLRRAAPGARLLVRRQLGQDFDPAAGTGNNVCELIVTADDRESLMDAADRAAGSALQASTFETGAAS
jgi:biotin carboxylase